MAAGKSDFWYMTDPHDSGASMVHEPLFAHVKGIEEEQKSIHLHNLYNAKLTYNRVLPALTWGSHTQAKGSHSPVNLRHENLIANGVDTAKAQIGKMRPKATPVPRDANFSVERQAKHLDRWLQTKFREEKVYEKVQTAFEDCCWAAVAAVYIGRDGDELYAERVFPDEIVVDQKECISEPTPIQVHRRRVMPKVTLAAMYPDHAEAIEKAGQSDPHTTYRRASHDQVVVIESWQLALPGQKYGKHAVVIETATLEYEDYTRDYFPFIFMRWAKLPTGFYGRSLAEEGAPFQLRHNEINRVIQRSQDLASVVRVMAHRRSKFQAAQLDNEIGKVYEWEGSHRPEATLWGAVHPELYQQREATKAAFFEAIGFSRMSAQAKLPDGVRLDSSKALREANYKQNERFQPQSAMLEDAYLEIAKRFIDLGIEIYADKKAPKEVTERTIEDEIDWKLLGRPGISYSLQLQASSLNNLTPAAREDQVNTWAQNGWLTPTEAKAKSGHPDLEEDQSLWGASIDDIKATVEELDRGEAPQPDNLQNLEYGLVYVHTTLLKRKRQPGVPEEILQGYRDWLAEADAILKAEQPQQQPQDPAAMQAAALQSVDTLEAPVGPEGVPLSALAIQ